MRYATGFLRIVFFAESAARFLADAVSGLVAVRAGGFTVVRLGDLAVVRADVLEVVRAGGLVVRADVLAVMRGKGLACVRADVVRDLTGVVAVFGTGLTGVLVAAVRAGESDKGGSPRT